MSVTYVKLALLRYHDMTLPGDPETRRQSARDACSVEIKLRSTGSTSGICTSPNPSLPKYAELSGDSIRRQDSQPL